MIKGAMDQLTVGDPWDLSCDVGPVIDAEAKAGIDAYIEAHRDAILHQVGILENGTFVAPTLIEVGGIGDLDREVFGPVLHVARFKARDLGKVVEDVNARGFGLTFGLHTRIDDRVQEVCEAVHVGNTYVNRNQIGAIVGSQPFGGEGLSGTGPKAGGPHYVPRFFAPEPPVVTGGEWDSTADVSALAEALKGAEGGQVAAQVMPGPTGELNRLTTYTRPPVLCLGPQEDAAQAQAEAVRALGGEAVVATGELAPESLATFEGFSAVLWWGDATTAREIARVLAARTGPITPLLTAMPDAAHVLHERHLCVDTTAAGGNAALLAG